MHTPTVPAQRNPLVNVAAVAVIVASLTAVAALTGMLPAAHSEKGLAPVEAAAATRPGLPAARAFADESAASPRVAAATCANCGVVEAVRAVQVKGQGSGIGAVAGGVAGAAVGSQLGRGHGRTAMGILGAVGGAYAGNAIEKNINAQTSYRVAVRMQDGSLRTVSLSAPPPYAVGDRVRLENGVLAARG